MMDGAWILKTSFYAMRWREWLQRHRAPDLAKWADTRAERDTRLDRETVAYFVPSLMPPIASDDEGRDEVYSHIKFRLGIVHRAVAA